MSNADALLTAVAKGATIYAYPAETTYHDEAPFSMNFPEWYIVVPTLSGGSKWLPRGVHPIGSHLD